MLAIRSRDLEIAPTGGTVIGVGSLSGFSIALIFHSLDHSLSLRLILIGRLISVDCPKM